MYAQDLPSDGCGGGAGDLFASVRARGVIDVSVSCRDSRTVRQNVREEGALRVRFPREGGGRLDAVIVNVAGGMTGGDDFAICLEAKEHTHVAVSTTAAEKIYRSLGPSANLAVTLRAAAGSRLLYLPQESILFEGARLRRSYEIDTHESAALTFCDLTVLGRAAMGEELRDLVLRDRLRLRRNGRLVVADQMALRGDVTRDLGSRATGRGAIAFGTLLFAGPGVDDALLSVRNAFASQTVRECEAGASLVDGVVVVRLLARSGYALRRMAVCVLNAAGIGDMPRSWST